MARKKISTSNGNGNGNGLKVLYTGDTKNFNKFTVITDGFVGGVYFPIEKDIAEKTITMTLVMPSDPNWKEEMEKLIKNTSNPKALGNLTKCLNSN